MNTFVKRLVSIVIPVLNCERYITRCLLSIRNLRFRQEEYEVLIMDNGSTDKTQQIVCDMGYEFQVLPNVNVSALRNRGVAMAKGDHVAFVDSDVELSRDWLENGLMNFKDRRVLACGGPRRVPRDSTWVQQTWSLHLCSRRPELEPTPVPWLYSMAFIVRRDEFLAIGGFSEHLETGEDVDLCYRLGQHGKILYDPEMEAVHLGEDPDLRSFWRKEVWRGIGNLKGIFSHGLRMDEMPSLGYPLYVLFLILSLSSIIGFWRGQATLIPINLGLMMMPAMVLAVNTVSRTRRLSAFYKLFLLYLVYGFARAYSLIKALRFKKG